MKVHVGLSLTFVPRPAPEGAPGYGSFEDFLDAVMEQLIDHGAEAPDITGSLASGQVEISLYLDADSIGEAAGSGSALIRTAIHAAHGNTANWPDFTEDSLDARPAEVLQEA